MALSFIAAVLSSLSSPVCELCSLQRLVLELLVRLAELDEWNAMLEMRNAELEARLARYENMPDKSK